MATDIICKFCTLRYNESGGRLATISPVRCCSVPGCSSRQAVLIRKDERGKGSRDLAKTGTLFQHRRRMRGGGNQSKSRNAYLISTKQPELQPLPWGKKRKGGDISFSSIISVTFGFIISAAISSALVEARRRALKKISPFHWSYTRLEGQSFVFRSDIQLAPGLLSLCYTDPH